MSVKKFLLATSLTAMMATGASASTFTNTSPTSEGLLPAAVTEIGGLVFDLIGLNGTRVVSQIAASGLFTGFSNANPFVVGSQAGYNAAITNALGGGIAEASVRVSLFDGDTGVGDFDDGENTLLVNGVSFGDFSAVTTNRTDQNGVDIGGNSTGFRDNVLDTGFFYSTNAVDLAALFLSIVGTETLVVELDDVDPGDNFFDFTQGIDGSLINVGSGPVVQPPSGVPLPAAGWLLFAGLGGLGAMRRRKGKASA